MRFIASVAEKSQLSKKINLLKILPQIQSFSFSTHSTRPTNSRFNLLFFCPRSQDHLNDFDRIFPNLIRGTKPKSISITDTAHNPDNSNRAIAKLINNHISANMIIPHIAMIAHSKSGVDERINYFKAIGISDLLVIRGNPVVLGKSKDYKHPQGYDNMEQLLRRIKNLAPNIKIIVGGYPEKHPFAQTFDDDIQELKKKVDCGADKIITQHFFDKMVFVRFIYECNKNGINLPMIPSIMPIGSPKYIFAFSRGANIALSEEVLKIYRKGGVREEDNIIKNPAIEKEAVEYSAGQINELMEIPQIERINTYVANNVSFLTKVLVKAGVEISSDYEREIM